MPGEELLASLSQLQLLPHYCVGLLLQPLLKDLALELCPGPAPSYPHTNAKMSENWEQGEEGRWGGANQRPAGC